MGMGMNGIMRLLLGGGEYCLNCILCIQFISSRFCWGMDDASALVCASCLSRTCCVSLACSMCQCMNMLAVHWHGRGKHLGMCLVLQPHASCVGSLEMCQCLNMLAVHGPWTRQASGYVPCAQVACIVCHEFVVCVNV